VQGASSPVPHSQEDKEKPLAAKPGVLNQGASTTPFFFVGQEASGKFAQDLSKYLQLLLRTVFLKPLILRARHARKIKGFRKTVRSVVQQNFSNSQYELQSGEFAPFGRELSALKPKNSPPLAGCFWVGFQNENC